DATRYWENDGSGRFRSRNPAVGLVYREVGSGGLFFDADNDGDLDVFVVNNASGPLFYRNQSAGAGSWLRVSLAGVTSNRQGLGARVSVFADGLPEQIREAGVSTHFLGQSEDAMHFGLAESESADLVIRWPASGLVTTLNDVPADSWIRVVEGESGYEVLNP
ncbi:MAG: CRTAC1 family protein, partial [Chloroflexi bacterium]|nr:CRTAC1 family protein [Chloroflexota bacterium]